MKGLLLFVLMCLALFGVLLTISACLFIIVGMGIYVTSRRLLGYSRPTAP